MISIGILSYLFVCNDLVCNAQLGRRESLLELFKMDKITKPTVKRNIIQIDPLKIEENVNESINGDIPNAFA